MTAIRLIFGAILLFFVISPAYPDDQSENIEPVSLNNFIIEGSIFKDNLITIIAANQDDTPIKELNGTFNFSINGFEQKLKFKDGAAIIPQPIAKSTFLYVRHENESGTQGKLYYLISKYDTISPIKISWLILIIVPAIIVLLAMMFRKFIIIAGILLLLIFYFNSSKGLNLPTFLDTIFDGLKNVI